MADIESPPVVEYGRPRRGLRRPAAVVVRFVLSLAACTAACTVFWQSCVTDVLYHCTDSFGLDYLQGPNHWVHGAAAGQPGNYGDTIQPGWSIGRLKALWFALIGACLVVSVFLSLVRWPGPRHHTKAPSERAIP